MHRFPVLIWEDLKGLYTAKLIDDEEDPVRPLAGLGRSGREALAQLKEYLVWSFEHEPWRSTPDFQEPRLVELRVDVRPEYRVQNRIYPCDESIPLRVACIHGRQEGGMLVCALPMLGLQFYYYEARALRGLVNAYVQETLKNLTPQQISRYLPPKSAQLEEITLPGGRRAAAKQAVPEFPNLRLVADPLGGVEMRRSFSRAYGREKEVSQLVDLIVRERANVLLLGESGVGKTSVLIDAVHEIERGMRLLAKKDSEEAEVALPSKGQKFWVSSAARLISGMKYLGQWEERCERVIEELGRVDGVIAFEDLLDLIRTGGISETNSIASFLLPFLERGELRLVVETTPAGLDAGRRLLPGFIDVFRILHIPKFGDTEALAVLQAYCTGVERNRTARIPPAVRGEIYRLFKRFMPYEAFPGKTVNFMTRLYERAKREHLTVIGTDLVLYEFVKLTGLPELLLRDEVPLDEADVQAYFETEVIGQSEAAGTATSLALTFKAGLNDPARPLGVFLFTGPTGVGKTELARTLGRFFFGGAEDSDRFVRLDMSEYSLPGSAERLVSSATGEPSEFINRLRRQPFTVILLDEIEKADQGVFDLLLSVLDEGRLTDRYGRTTQFRSAVIIMTSNLGSVGSDPPGFGSVAETAGSTYDRAAQTFFRPEFYNRIDAVVSFRSLDRETVRRIVAKELHALSSREGLLSRGIKLFWTDRLVEYLMQQGFNARFGARPLQRTIEAEVVAPLAFYLNREVQVEGKEVHLDFAEIDGRVTID